MLSLEIETSTDSVLSRGHSSWNFYRENVARFGGDELVVLALPAAEPFDPETLAEIKRITRELERVDGVRRVDSISSFPIVRLSPDGSVDLSPALAAFGGDAASVRRVEEVLRTDRIAWGNLLSEDGRVFAITVLMTDLGAGYDETVVAAVQRASPEAAWISGGPVFRVRTNELTMRELATFVPLTVLFIAVLLFLVFRSLAAVAAPLISVGCATWIVLGLMGALSVPLTITTTILPSVLLALGCAYSMHVLVAASGCSTEGLQLLRAVEPVLRPVALSGLTTSIGFAAMALVRIDSVRYVAAFGALGALLVMLAAVTLVPALLRLRPLPDAARGFAVFLSDRPQRKISSLVHRRRGAVLGGWAIATGVLLVGVWRVEVETDVILWFSKGTPIREDYRQIREALVGISPMNVVVSSRAGRAVTEPDVLRAIDGLSSYLQGLPEVGRAISVADPLRQIHGAFLGQETQPLPEARDLAEQYLLLLESVKHTQDVVTADRQHANVLLRVDNNGSDDLLRVARLAEVWWRENGVEDFRARTTGIMHEYARSETEIENGQLRGLAFALLAISVILLLLFRSPGLAAVALVPNAVPLVFAFGGMGFLGIPLDAGTVFLGSLALGMAVDDSIHLAVHYSRQIQRGDSPVGASVRALRVTLPAISYTTAAIAGGFAILGLSSFTFTRNLGLLTAGIMVVCYLADVILLMALLGMRPWGRKRDAVV